MEKLQTELLKLASSKADYEDVADEIYRLREHPTAITEYDEHLVRRLIEKVTVYKSKFAVEFKSGVTVNVKDDDKTSKALYEFET
ncbi:hypothetical protein [Desulfosporosinus sp. Sb-LF]|uniref:hypothetical protein n=1 Tax=Desulfosporosinus sp. Sb-LF TaxID=2560027 RepID=UPI001FB05542|nr:hypothetical protein [Desulfosporosinus sp. Sb-LF]